MYAICIEASHSRGLGHLFRALNIIDYFVNYSIPYIVFVNENSKAEEILNKKNVSYKTVDLHDYNIDWETTFIKKYDIKIWINDRLDTELRHSINVKKNNIILVTFDDKGTGSNLADLNIAALSFGDDSSLGGKKVLTGPEYLVLNKEIDVYKRLRTECNKIIITLGGSDTYGVTIKAIELLKLYNKSATVILGPCFSHHQLLKKVIGEGYNIKSDVHSLISEFSYYDLAITAGGITPFEANASGLPCIIIATEPHEIQVGNYLEQLGSSLFAGFRNQIDEKLFDLSKIKTMNMSIAGIKNISTGAVEKILREINKL